MPSPEPRVVGILGAGRVGMALARQALRSGFTVLVATAKPPSEIALTVATVAPGVDTVTAEELVRDSDVIVLAIPLRKYRTLRPELLAGKVVVDIMNYWAPTDGIVPEFEATVPSSLAIQHFLPEARLVRTLNHLAYHEFEDDALPAGSAGRRAVAVAGDDPAARDMVAAMIDQLGFDPVDAGPLAAARAYAPGTALFGVALTRRQMEHALPTALADGRPDTEAAGQR